MVLLARSLDCNIAARYIFCVKLITFWMITIMYSYDYSIGQNGLDDSSGGRGDSGHARIGISLIIATAGVICAWTLSGALTRTVGTLEAWVIALASSWWYLLHLFIREPALYGFIRYRCRSARWQLCPLALRFGCTLPTSQRAAI